MNYFHKVFGYSICWCSYGWHNSSHWVVLFRFMSFYCTIQSRWYRIWRIYLEVYSLSVNFFFLSQHNIFWILLVNFHVGSFSGLFALPGCFSIFCEAFFLTILQILSPYRIDKLLCLCCSSFAPTLFFVVWQIVRKFYVYISVKNLTHFWRRHSASVSLLLFSKSIAHVFFSWNNVHKRYSSSCWNKVRS